MTTEMAKEPSGESNVVDQKPVEQKRFGNVETTPVWGTIACGAGLFSDGFLNAVSFLQNDMHNYES
jgi:hypothetical protein